MGLLRGIARTAAVAGTATAVSNNVSRRQATRWNKKAAAETDEAADQQQPEQQDAAPADDTDEQIVQLKKLAELKDAGVLTQDEFDYKKKQILGM